MGSDPIDTIKRGGQGAIDTVRGVLGNKSGGSGGASAALNAFSNASEPDAMPSREDVIKMVLEDQLNVLRRRGVAPLGGTNTPAATSAETIQSSLFGM